MALRQEKEDSKDMKESGSVNGVCIGVGGASTPGPPPLLQPRAGHALAYAAFLDKGFFQVSELPVEQVAGDANERDNHVRGNRRVRAFDTLAKRRVGDVRGLVQLAETNSVGVVLGPFLEAAHPQEIAIIDQQLFETGPRNIGQLDLALL